MNDWIDYERQKASYKLERLKENIPTCSPCEQCQYGYRFDEETLIKCKEKQLKIQEEREIHKEKIKILELELDYLNKRRAEVGE